MNKTVAKAVYDKVHVDPYVVYSIHLLLGVIASFSLIYLVALIALMGGELTVEHSVGLVTSLGLLCGIISRGDVLPLAHILFGAAVLHAFATSLAVIHAVSTCDAIRNGPQVSLESNILRVVHCGQVEEFQIQQCNWRDGNLLESTYFSRCVLPPLTCIVILCGNKRITVGTQDEVREVWRNALTAACRSS